MKKPNINASTLKIIMRSIIVISICLSVLGFYIVQKSLNTFATEVGAVVSKSTTPSDGLVNSNSLKNEIAKYQTSSDKAGKIAFSSLNFKDEISKYISKYTSLNNISVTDFSYSNTAMTQAVGILATDNVTVTLSGSVNFTDLMQFLKSIESTIPKMQISKINLTRNTDKTLTVAPITIEFYTR